MKFHIKKIVLWPRRRGLKPREVVFTTGAVNVISGASKTGKSAIIPIIDYCLGSSDCKIPVDTIRDACAWFGVVIETESGQKLFCRREPGQQKSTDHMYFAESSGDVSIPVEIKKNNTRGKVKRILDEFAGLTNLDFDVHNSGSGFKGRPSFGDMKAFCFQPQNIVANPDVLFFKADTAEHREKLKTIFPYVLNAVTPEVLAAQHEHAAVRKELLRKNRDLDVLRTTSSNWISELKAWVTEAREVGLIEEVVADDATADQMIAVLRLAAETTGATSPTSQGIADVVEEIVELRQEESDATAELAQLTRRFAEMSKLKDSADAYSGAMEIQRDRLAISKWLKTLQGDDVDCPLCKTIVPAENTELDVLCETLDQLELEASVSKAIPASFDRELSRVRGNIKVVTERLQGLRLRLSSAESRTKASQQERYRLGRVERLMGRIEQALSTYDSITEDGELASEVAELEKRLAALAKMFSEREIWQRTENALKRLTNLASRIVPDLDAEHESDPVELSINDLTVRVIGRERGNYLWEIGSGANWLSYHIAIAVSLQQLFLEFPHTPVPGFVVFDQPSQVYFPRKLARGSDYDQEPEWSDEDVVAVRKVFNALVKAAVAANGKLQFIVLDHAAEDVWGEIDGVNSVAEWRDGEKLVPALWYE